MGCTCGWVLFDEVDLWLWVWVLLFFVVIVAGTVSCFCARGFVIVFTKRSDGDLIDGSE